MTITPAVIEARARQLCAADGHDPDRMWIGVLREPGSREDFGHIEEPAWIAYKLVAEEQLRAEERNDGS